MSGRLRPISALALALLLGGCDRPFVPVRPPDIEVLSPDPTAVVTGSDIDLRIRATSFRAVSRVVVDGREAASDGTDEWVVPVSLEAGLNTIVITAFDEEDVPGTDTLRLLRMRGRTVPGPVWPEPEGGHTATLLPDGRVFIAGGAAAPGAAATRHTWWLEPGTGSFSRGPDLASARTGHTATLLPDGRLVVVGGSRVDPPGSVDDLVESVELLDPDANVFHELPVSGDPVRRAFHTATWRETSIGAVVDVIGGTGDVRYGAQPRLDVRDDLRSFLVGTDTVKALIGWFGVYIDVYTGHTQTALDDGNIGSGSRYLLSGTLFGTSNAAPRNYVMDTRDPLGILLEPIDPPSPPRNEHAAVRLAPGRVLLVGGRTADRPADDGGAVFDDLLGIFIRVPADALGTREPRRRHTATFLSDGRILLLGGYDRQSEAQATSGYLYID